MNSQSDSDSYSFKLARTLNVGGTLDEASGLRQRKKPTASSTSSFVSTDSTTDTADSGGDDDTEMGSIGQPKTEPSNDPALWFGLHARKNLLPAQQKFVQGSNEHIAAI